MHPLIERLIAEHHDLQQLVGWLAEHPSLRAHALAEDVALMVDAMIYLTQFPDITHHPLEDRIAQRLLIRQRLDPALIHELESQHARLALEGQALLRDLEGAVREESMSPELAVANARLYAERLRHNMAFEELTLFPAAEQHLDAGDWAHIAPSAQLLPPDPLFHAQADERFAQLHRAIASGVGCDCV